MKKITLLILITLLLCAFTGCVDKDEKRSEDGVKTQDTIPGTDTDTELDYYITDGRLIPKEDYIKPTNIEKNDEGTYDLDRTRDDLSSYEVQTVGKYITKDELLAPLNPSEFRTYFSHFDGTAIIYSSMYSFPFFSHTNNTHDTSFNGRSISSLIGQGDITPFETMNVSSESDYAYIIQTLAKRKYRKATEDDRKSYVSNPAFIAYYIDNPDGTTDCFWCDANLYVMHRTGEDLPGTYFMDVSVEPLTEEEFAHLHVIAASYLYAKTDFILYPFKYSGFISADVMPSDEISIMIIKDNREVILENDDVDRLIEIIKSTDLTLTEKTTLLTCTSIEDFEWDKMVHLLAIKKKDHIWEDRLYWDDLYVTTDGKIIRKREIIQSTISGGNEGMNIKGPFFIMSMYNYPIMDLIDEIISQ